MLYIDLSPDTAIRLDGCTGERYEEDLQVPRGSGCEAHNDVNAVGKREYGPFLSRTRTRSCRGFGSCPRPSPPTSWSPSTPRRGVVPAGSRSTPKRRRSAMATAALCPFGSRV